MRWSRTRAPDLTAVSPEPSPHRTSTFQRIRRATLAELPPCRCTTRVPFSPGAMRQPRAARASFRQPRCRDPFALWQHGSASLGGRDSTGDYGSAAPTATLAPCLPPRRGGVLGSGVAHTARSSSAVGALPFPFSLASQVGKPIPMDEMGHEAPAMRPESRCRFGSKHHTPLCCAVASSHPMRHLFLGRVRRAQPRIAHHRAGGALSGDSGFPRTGAPERTSAPSASGACDSPAPLVCVPSKLVPCLRETTVLHAAGGEGEDDHAHPRKL